MKYIAEVIKTQIGKNLFDKTILFSLLACETEIPIDTEHILVLRNTGAFASGNSHACSYVKSPDNEIWVITIIRVFIDTSKKKLIRVNI